MTTTQSRSGRAVFATRANAVLHELESTGQLKRLQMIEGPMDATITLRDYGEVACFCSNNYLGLANHPAVRAAGIAGIERYGAGTASVRFICGTFDAHEQIERRIAEFLGVEAAYTFVSCWTATEALLPTLCEPGDIIVSDELNHACIIDAMRLATSIKKGVHKTVYKHSDMVDLRAKLEAARSNPDVTGVAWVITDGVFSMEGDIAKLPEIRALCDEYGALLAVDDSHGTGVMGATGRGTHEHHGLAGHEIDFFTGTLGKALGGGAGGYLAGSRAGIELIVQRARPTIFTNALPCTVAYSADKAIETLMNEPQRVARLRDNVAYVREGIRRVGFEVLDSPTAICPIIIGDTGAAIRWSNRLLDLGVFVIGFGYPVVPEGTARLRVQVSAAHERRHLDALIGALETLRSEVEQGRTLEGRKVARERPTPSAPLRPAVPSAPAILPLMTPAPTPASIFGRPQALVGMIHVGALPGTPRAAASVTSIVDQAVEEARVLAAAGFDALIIENMHDVPYLLRDVGPEIVASMTRVAQAVREAIDLPLGVQVLAGANAAALAVAHSAGAGFIRAEGFVFAAVADEGLMAEADAGPLLRYRRAIGAADVRILADVKKKHSAHALTADVDLAETVRAAEFAGADGVVVTGAATGRAVAADDVVAARAATRLPVVIGSGVTPENAGPLLARADALIVGSSCKIGGHWANRVDPDRAAAVVRSVREETEGRRD